MSTQLSRFRYASLKLSTLILEPLWWHPTKRSIETEEDTRN